MALWRLDTLPTNDRDAAVTRKKLRQPEAFDRLLQRAQIAQAIADARAAGPYEIAEDAASQVIDADSPRARVNNGGFLVARVAVSAGGSARLPE